MTDTSEKVASDFRYQAVTRFQAEASSSAYPHGFDHLRRIPGASAALILASKTQNSQSRTRETVKMKIVAGLCTLMVAILIVVSFLKVQDSVILVLFILVVMAISILLGRAFALLQEIAESDSTSNLFFGRAHLVAHIVPFSYLIATHLGDATFALNWVYLIPFLFFYYSGRRLWKMLFAHFGTKLYQFFVFGNTGMMTGLTVLTILGLVWPERIGPASFETVLLCYFTVHFLLTGITILRIESDLRRQSDSPTITT